MLTIARNCRPTILCQSVPRPQPDAITKAVIDLVTARFSNHFGELENFAWPVTQEEAEADFEYFLDNCLPMFGDYQDAMKSGEAFVYHSLVGASLNLGLLDPLEVCRRRKRACTPIRHRSTPLKALFARYWAGANLFAGSIG